VNLRGEGPSSGPRGHAIRGGHFARRKEILRQVMVDKAVPAPVVRALLDYTESLRAQVTTDVGSECAG
jgi:hypothetical protein